MTEPALPLWELIQTSHVVTRAFKELFARHDLTPMQFGVLACLADGDDFSKAELARAILVTPQSMDALIETLLNRGLVSRDLPARRGRRAGIRITTLGQSVFAQALPDVVALNAPSNIAVAPDEVPDLIRQLQAIRAQLDNAPSAREE